jgi:hypothetical protein
MPEWTILSLRCPRCKVLMQLKEFAPLHEDKLKEALYGCPKRKTETGRPISVDIKV